MFFQISEKLLGKLELLNFILQKASECFCGLWYQEQIKRKSSWEKPPGKVPPREKETLKNLPS